MFYLQIVNGMYYKNEAQKKLIRVNSIMAPRGEILDRYGKVLANNRPAFTVEITKTTDDEDVLNNSLQQIIEIFQKNNDKYKDNLPILSDKFVFGSDSELIMWKKKYGISPNSTPNEAFVELRKKYHIDKELQNEDAKKVVALRYEMSEQGYNSFKSVVLAFDVSKETISEIEERHQQFPGVNVVVNPIRNYPNGSLASQVLGYIGNINEKELEGLSSLGYKYSDIVGKDGIESTSEVYLKGTNGKKFVETDLSGRFSQSLENQKPVQGGKVVLTIDKDIQLVAETALEETIKKIKSGGFSKTYSDVKGGVALAIDVNTGEILALANYPNYNPGIFSKGISLKEWQDINNDSLRPLFNRAISGKYAPGSTFKMVTALAALENGTITADEKILDKGKYDFYKDYQPACWIWNSSHGTHGYVNVTDALKVSCNYYFYEIGRRLGIERLYEYASKFGLNQKTGIELKGEVTGIVASPTSREQLYNFNKYLYPNKVWYPGDTLQASIGQSDSAVTPIEMASYISILANGGTKYQLHIIKSEKSFDEKQIFTEKSSDIISTIDIKDVNYRAVIEGMRQVANDESGTAYSTFAGFPIEIAAKTGTSQTGIGGKSPHGWFVGFAPFDKPQIAVVVLIENGGSGGYSAPVAKEIFAQYFGLNKEPLLEDNADINSSDLNIEDLPNQIINEGISEPQIID